MAEPTAETAPPISRGSASLRAEARLAEGVEHQQAGRPDQAEAAYREVLRAHPRHAQALNLLGLLNTQVGRSSIGIALFRKAIAIDSTVAAFHTNLGNALHGQGRLDESLAIYERALALDPENVRAHSNWLVALHYLPDYPREQLATAARAWGVRHAEPLSSTRVPHTNRAEPNRRLHVGYVSGELYQHPVSYFFEALLDAHDRTQVEVTCYTNSRRSDQVTKRLAAASDRWRTLVNLGDAQAAEMIRADGIDVLVDLSGHLGNHRLLTFAHKPAPVQATWMGYFDTTGVGAIDYLIADGVVCPEREDDLYVERVVRLAECYLCYRPPEFAPAVTALPMTSNGRVVFGSFNRLAKANPRVLATWAEILRAVPDSQLAMKGSDVDDPNVVTRLRRFFGDRGVASQRLLLLGPSPQAEFLAAYSGVDIALDTFPYSGSTTSAEALWMGVPVVTLNGDRFVARTTETILRAVGLDELIASSEAEYVHKTVALVGDRERLTQLRAGLRRRMSTSGLCDGRGFARAMEAAYRDMWRTWCIQQRAQK